MIALNIFLMLAVTVGIVSLLAWAIATDPRKKQATTTAAVPSFTPPQQRLASAHQSRVRRAHIAGSARGQRAKAHSTLA